MLCTVNPCHSLGLAETPALGQEQRVTVQGTRRQGHSLETWIQRLSYRPELKGLLESPVQ